MERREERRTLGISNRKRVEFQRGNHESTEMKTQVNKLKIKIKIKSKYWAQLKLK